MAVIVFVENIEGTFHKPSLEALTYAFDTAQRLGMSVTAVAFGKVQDGEFAKLGRYGASRILHADTDVLNTFDSGAYAKVLQQAVEKENGQAVIMSSTFNGKSLAARLSARVKAGLVSNAVDLPDTASGFTVKKPVFSGKGFGYFNVKSPVKIVTIAINSYKIVENAQAGQVENWQPQVSADDVKVKVLETKRQKGKVSLTEAEIVVSGGRGMKGPENWNLIEELADVLGAATACSKPVSDIGWRPHSEHVGQTGITISPNLYIAAGISGAIQHLAGVSGSKVIVAINKDPEAPFFKAANYGIVGDALEVLPKLTEAARKVKQA